MNTQSSSMHPAEPARLSARMAILVYGGLTYTVFLGIFLYAIGFIGNFGVPKSMDSPGIVPWQEALWIDLTLLSVFALQHSIMARPAFKRVLTRLIPQSAERSTYVLMSSLALCLLFWKWQPLGGTVWHVESAVGRGLLYAGYAFGWGLVLVSTIAINHFDLFGLRQVWRQAKGQPQAAVQFAAPLLYRIVRHPLYVGWLFAFWCTPVMTVTHLLFAFMTTAYILVAIRFEEADLMREHQQYGIYRRQVPMLIPRLTREVTLRDRNAVVSLVIAGILLMSMHTTARAQPGLVAVPAVPENLRVPAGHAAYLKTSAAGTQNYVCLPGADGPAWTFLGPQATLFRVYPRSGGERRQQILTHFLSSNPAEGGTTRPTWQHSVDSSLIWGNAAASSTDPSYVTAGAIPWLLVEITGTQRGPANGDALVQTTYIHRLKTSGGSRPETGCDTTKYGTVSLVPYTADYYFYRQVH